MKFESLPNEIFLECLQYFDGLQIFHSFDQLNSRFNRLIRTIPLYVNFDEIKQCLFDKFCQTILLNPEIKQTIIYLKLSNDKIYQQIENFFSLFSLNEFLHLRSLSLFGIYNGKVQQIQSNLSYILDLHYFHCTTYSDSKFLITSALTKSKIEILNLRKFTLNSTDIYETMSLTSLTVYECTLNDICHLFKYTPMLKYLEITKFCKSEITNNELDITNTNVGQLKKLIIHYSEVKFEEIELLLKCLSNLNIFSIRSHEITIIDAARWQYLIENSLPHLHIFKFNFSYSAYDSSDEKLSKIRKFQTDFWQKQHQWYTINEIDQSSASVYTIPNISRVYTLGSTTKIYENSLVNNSTIFNNVTSLYLVPKAIGNNSLSYFRNVKSLRLSRELIFFNNDDEEEEEKTYECDISRTHINNLHRIVNLSCITYLEVGSGFHLSSCLLTKILQKLSNVNSLEIPKPVLISYLENRQLCKILNKKIKKLYIPSYSSRFGCQHIKLNQIDWLYKAFSNLEQLKCSIKNIQCLVSLLEKFSQLSRLTIVNTNAQIKSWINTNASTFNVHFDTF
ncbi:unnamed protein product [Adineta steineri]|uniref:F-box domain-containing protein n=1 Tax=Adineta steineri TaxID=433720 RepID=A0A813Q943_9BILA|nr:unnamed protein product [Adineta steineri]CAF1032483.1 unnamed protein product [Adineta steineri]